MLDEYTGKAGTFITDPESGTRMPLKEYQAKAEKAEKAEKKAALEEVPKATAKKAKDID